jgi:membrane complex biogenesis BtpA family protein
MTATSGQTMNDWFKTTHPIIGMLHVPALPGSPLWAGKLGTIVEHVARDVQALVEGGVHGLMIENFGDVPFYPGRVPASVVAHLTALAIAVKRQTKLPLGINVLRNDGLSALAIAHAVGAELIRVNVLTGARVADQGLLQGIAHDLLRERRHLGAGNVKIFADVDVKHSAALARRDIADEVGDTIERGLADAVIVSGTGTGKTTDLQHLMNVKAVAGATPVFVGSGISERTIDQYLPHADGFIVGTALKVDGKADNAVDVERVKRLVKYVR